MNSGWNSFLLWSVTDCHLLIVILAVVWQIQKGKKQNETGLIFSPWSHFFSFGSIPEFLAWLPSEPEIVW